MLYYLLRKFGFARKIACFWYVFSKYCVTQLVNSTYASKSEGSFSRLKSKSIVPTVSWMVSRGRPLRVREEVRVLHRDNPLEERVQRKRCNREGSEESPTWRKSDAEITGPEFSLGDLCKRGAS